MVRFVTCRLVIILWILAYFLLIVSIGASTGATVSVGIESTTSEVVVSDGISASVAVAFLLQLLQTIPRKRTTNKIVFFKKIILS